MSKKKKIVFHKDFSKGWQFAVCLNCGYPMLFLGAIKYKGIYTIDCVCNKPKYKTFKSDNIEDFILKIQEVLYKLAQLSKTELKELDKESKELEKKAKILIKESKILY